MSKKKNDENSFVFYRSFYDVVNLIPDAAMRCRAYTAICEYAFNGTEPTEADDVLVRMVFTQAKPQIDANNKRRENASAGGIAKKKMQEAKECAEGVPTVCQTHAKDVPNANGNANANENAKENANENENGNSEENAMATKREAKNESKNESKREAIREPGYTQPNPGRFTPPTRAQVMEYIAEKELQIDGERFLDYYTSNGWMVGRNKMKDWKAALRQWHRGDVRNAAKNRVYDNNVCMKGEKQDGQMQPQLGLCL